ncbi:transposase [Neorhizobium huautlense]|uniref:transposase n=1 Tax=Neorhizobium huautlense TaxID=67774 RepID=UPI0035943354
MLGSAPAVCPATVGVLIACLPELGQRNRRAISALAGLTPLPRDSGKIAGQVRSTVKASEQRSDAATQIMGEAVSYIGNGITGISKVFILRCGQLARFPRAFGDA